jgi:hypothetical protein
VTHDLIHEKPRDVAGKLKEQHIRPGQKIENLCASERNPTREGTYRGFKKKRSVTGWRSGGISGKTEHFTDLVVVDTPGGVANIINDEESKWRIWE